MQALPEQGERLLYDLSYEVNHTLWDRYFISAADEVRKMKFAADPVANPLPNPRHQLCEQGHSQEVAADLADFHRAAFRLMVEGAFNINSVSVDAWATMLAGTRLNGPNGASTMFSSISGNHEPARHLSDLEIRGLAEAIVIEVKRRGPFLGMADFVNRRLSLAASGKCGTLEAAIRTAGVNSEKIAGFPLTGDEPNGVHPPEIDTPLEIHPGLKPASTVWGTPGFLTQGDILQTLGDSFSVRSDTFVIRAYGESFDRQGNKVASARCEAVLQRVPTPVKSPSTGISPRMKLMISRISDVASKPLGSAGLLRQRFDFMRSPITLTLRGFPNRT